MGKFRLYGVDSRSTMNVLRKLDRIRSPYSTVVALLVVGLVGGYFVWRGAETRSLGIGMMVGGVLVIVLKAAAEVSDREVWRRVRMVFGGKTEESSDARQDKSG